MIRSLVSTIILAALFVGCGDGTGPESGTRVTIGFTAGSSAAQTSGAQAAASRAWAGPGQLAIPGSNGTLTISDVWFIVAEFELEKAEGSCMSSSELDCHDFEADPTFLHLPLDGDFVPVATSDIPDGSYDELEFEVEDLLHDDDDDDDDDEDDDDADEAAQIAAVRAQIADAGITDWPDDASMLIEGVFQPVDDTGNPSGDPVPFRVYFDAEIEIEIEIDLVIPTLGDEPLTLTVDVHPDLWFTRANGDVLDLSQFNWDPAMELLEFEFEFESDHHGFEIEIEIG